MPAKATVCEQPAAICERYLPMVTQHFVWRSCASQSNNLWATCCHLWVIFTYSDTASWLEVLRLAKGFPILECHFQQLFVNNLLPFVSDIYLWWHSILAEGPEACQRLPILACHLQQIFVSNLLPFVSDIYLWWHSILAWGPEACQRVPNVGAQHGCPLFLQPFSRRIPAFSREIYARYTDKKENKIFLIYKESRRERLQSHIWRTASSYMTKYLRISSYIRTPFLIYDFAPEPIWISL